MLLSWFGAIYVFAYFCGNVKKKKDSCACKKFFAWDYIPANIGGPLSYLEVPPSRWLSGSVHCTIQSQYLEPPSSRESLEILISIFPSLVQTMVGPQLAHIAQSDTNPQTFHPHNGSMRFALSDWPGSGVTVFLDESWGAPMGPCLVSQYSLTQYRNGIEVHNVNGIKNFIKAGPYLCMPFQNWENCTKPPKLGFFLPVLIFLKNELWLVMHFSNISIHLQ